MVRSDVESVRIFVNENDSSKIKASATVAFANGLIVRRFRVIDGRDGLWVGMPSVKKQDDSGEYSDIAFVPDRENRQVLSDVIIEHYRKELGDDGARERGTSGGKFLDV